MKRSILIAALIALAAVAWLASGQLTGNAPDAAATTDASDASNAPTVADAKPEHGDAAGGGHSKHAITVRVAVSNAVDHPMAINARGRTEAVRMVDVKAQAVGRVVKIYANKGQRLKKGQAVLQISTEAREAQRREAVALVEQRKLEYRVAKSLNKRGYRAETNVAAAQAALDSARANLTRIEVEIGHLIVRAPFDGIVVRRYKQIGDFIDVGSNIISIMDEDPFLVVADVSEQNVTNLLTGSNATARLIDGSTRQGTIRYISPVADANTRTFKVEVEVPNPDRDIRDGTTSDVSLNTGSMMAHRIAPAALTLNDEGTLGLRVVDSASKVRFFPVHVVSDNAGEVWVAGLPQTVRIITVGHEFVREGQKVDYVMETAELRK